MLAIEKLHIILDYQCHIHITREKNKYYTCISDRITYYTELEKESLSGCASIGAKEKML